MLGEAMSGVLSGEGGELVEVEVDEGVVVAVSVHDAGELAFEVGDGLLALACGDVGVCVARRRRGHRSSPASARSWRMPRMVAGSMSARANHPASWSTFSASAVSSSMSVSFSVVAVGAGVAGEEPSDDGDACEVGGDGVVEDGLGGHPWVSRSISRSRYQRALRRSVSRSPFRPARARYLTVLPRWNPSCHASITLMAS